MLLLLVVAILYFVLGELRDAISAAVIIVVCIAVEIGSEYRAKIAVSTLNQHTHRPPVIVLRDGALKSVDPVTLVVGDIISVENAARAI